MHRSKNSFLEWLVYSLIFFFLYDIIWILVDLPDFLQSVSGLYPELLVDFALCGLFSLSSLYLNRWLFKQQRFWREWQGHRVFVQFDKTLGCLHINPGAAGKYGFHKVRTAIRFVIEKGKMKDLEVLELEKK